MALTVDIVKDEIETGASDEVLDRWIVAAESLVENYAPSAAEEIKDGASIRVIGMWASGAGRGVLSETDDTFAVRYAVGGAAGALIRSGGAEMLSPFRVHRAGIV